MTMREQPQLPLATAAAVSTSNSNRQITRKTASNVLYMAPLKKTSVTHHNNSYPHQSQLQQRVENIREVIMSRCGDNHFEELIIIDAVQRLGLELYFREEIDATLGRHFEEWRSKIKEKNGGGGGEGLHEVALRFRLLRQAGYYVPSDVFNKFKDKDGKLKEELCKDIKGLMSLFEASHLSIQEDDFLDDFGEISGQLLKTSFLKNVDQSKAEIIENTLANPFHKTLPRVLAYKNLLHNFKSSLELLHDFHKSNGWITEVQEIARINFNMAQLSYQNEIIQVSRWWKQLELTKNLKSVRDEPVKWHMWSLVVLPGPHMTEERIELTKMVSFVYLIDDIFDVCGTLEELTIFTQAVTKWEYSDIDGLPDYMKMCLRKLYDTTNEISHKLYIKHGRNVEDSLKESWAKLCNAFLVEARWFTSGELPSSENYLKNGIISCGVGLAMVHIFCLLGEGLNNMGVDLLNSYPDIVNSTATIFRLWDDLGSAKDENQDGNDGSYIDCYMKEHKGSSIESALDNVRKMIKNAWKGLNKECLFHSPFSVDFRRSCLNTARMIPIMYNYDNNGRLPTLENFIKSLLYESI